MGITITIENNREYCRERELQTYATYPCQCPDPDPDPNCFYCHGKGREIFETYPFELDLCNANFRTLWSALGFDAEDYGSIDGRVLLAALRRTPVELVERESVREGSIAFAGVGIHQASRYFNDLADIAEEAIRREELVYWA